MRKLYKNIYLLLLLLCLAWLKTYAQEVKVVGTLYDDDTKELLPAASVYDKSSKNGVFTNGQGQYQLNANDGDWIIFTYIGYQPDSIKVHANGRPAIRITVYLRKKSVYLEGVDITGRRIDYKRDSMERQYWFGDQAFSESKVNGFGAVASPVTALYDAFSKRQKRLWAFQKQYLNYEQQKYIESRLKESVVQELTGFDGKELDKFLNWYNPDYYYVRNATDYELFTNVKNAAKQFKMLEEAGRLQPPPMPGDSTP